MFILNLLNEGTRGGGDSYMHYLFARWSFDYPHLFFDHWGKPFFTILASPFAQFGFKGAVMFNILASIGSGVLVAQSAKKMGVTSHGLGLVMTVFTPLFFVLSFSSLTEILFAFTLILSIYFFVSEKYSWSAIVISFIPFARTEGVIFLPLFGLAFVMLKQYRLLLFLVAGFVVMALIGFPVHKDLLWPITKSPYHDSSALYGSGSLFHFVKKAPDIFGWPLIAGFLIGIATMIVSVAQKQERKFGCSVFLILGCSMGYFSAHSVVWAFGIGGSAGLTRVMAGIVPLLTLTAVFGFHYFLSRSNHKKYSFWMNIMIGGVFVIDGYTKNKFPLELISEEKVVASACNYIKDNGLDKEYIVYYSPFEAYLLGLDHFSTHKSRDRVLDNQKPSKGLKKGTIIIWDAHFGPNEGGLSREALLNDSSLHLLSEFSSKKEAKTNGDPFYEVLVFQKMNQISIQKDE